MMAGDGAAEGPRPWPASSTIVELLPVALVVVAEAAWISVVGGLFQEYAFREPILGIPELAAFVTAGSVTARLLARPLGGRWPVVALGLVALAAVAGWLLAPGARAALDEGIGPAIAAHPAGLLAGLAMLRGFAHARLPLDEGSVAHLLAFGVPGLVFVTMLGSLIADPFRARFLADTLAAAIVFIVAGTLALALARLAAIGQDAGFDWRRNPLWLLTALALLTIAIAAALPLSAVAGLVIQTILSIALGPLLIVGLASGLDRTARRVLLSFGIIVLALDILTVFFSSGGTLPQRPPIATSGSNDATVADQVMTVSLGALVLLVAIIAALVLVAAWMRRGRTPDDDTVAETRTIDRGEPGGKPRRARRRLGRRTAPAGAVEAYVALIDDLEPHPTVRRDAAETPAEHAARLRAAGRVELSLDLLAADYALAGFGGVELPAREERRAVARWRSLRRRLIRAPAPPG